MLAGLNFGSPCVVDSVHCCGGRFLRGAREDQYEMYCQVNVLDSYNRQAHRSFLVLVTDGLLL